MQLCANVMFDGDPVRLAATVRDLEAAGVDMVSIPDMAEARSSPKIFMYE